MSEILVRYIFFYQVLNLRTEFYPIVKVELHLVIDKNVSQRFVPIVLFLPISNPNGTYFFLTPILKLGDKIFTGQNFHLLMFTAKTTHMGEYH